jgi:hypothetical protein
MKSFKGGKKPANQGSAGKAFVQSPKTSGVPAGASKPANAMIKFGKESGGTKGSNKGAK